MSLPSYALKCTNCDYSNHYAFNVNYDVEGVDKDIRGILKQGWCNNCEKVVTIYSPTAFSSDDAQNEIDERIIIIEGLRSGFFGKLVERFSTERQEQIVRIETAIAAFKQWKLFVSTTTIRDRCLTCGSQDVQQVNLPSELLKPTKLGIDHECGGEIVASAVARVSYGNCPKVICDIQGKIIFDER